MNRLAARCAMNDDLELHRPTPTKEKTTMRIDRNLLKLATIAVLLLGVAACDESAPTDPGADMNPETDSQTSVLRGETLTQVDRMGFPAINTAVVIDDAAKDAFNAAAPSDDGQFAGFAVQQLETIYAVPPANGQALGGLLLPDILTLNGPVFVGRQPADDVIDAILGALFGPEGLSDLAPAPQLASDNIDANDVPFPETFPYLAEPHRG